MEPYKSKICIYLAGFVFFITCFLGMTSDVPVVTLAIRACIAAGMCLVLSRIVFRIFIEFFSTNTTGSNLRQHIQQPNEAVHGGPINDSTKRGKQET
jgi:hypothetical protein